LKISHGLLGLALILAQGNAVAYALVDSLRMHFVKRYDKQFFIGPVLRQRTVSFQLQNRFDKNNKITYRPNNEYNAGIRMHLFGIGLEGSVSIPWAKKSAARLGGSEVFDISFNSIGEKWISEFSYQRYNGLYLKPSWLGLKSDDVFPQRPDLEVRSTSFATMYIFNHRKFSEEAPYLFTEHQNNSSGSFLFGLIYSKFTVSSQLPIISEEDQTYFRSGADARHLDFVSFSLMPGYSYTFVHKNIFLNLTAQGGLAHYWINFQTMGGGNHYDIDINLSAAYRVALGYNGDNFFYGITFNSRNTRSEVLETNFSATSSTFRILAGLRIKEKGIFAKRLTDLEKLVFRKRGTKQSLASRQQ
jgi:hypothetical protein